MAPGEASLKRELRPYRSQSAAAADIDSGTPHTDLTEHHCSSDYNGVVSAALLALRFFRQSAAVADDPHPSALAAYRRHRYAKPAESLEKAVAAEAQDSRADRESVLLPAQSYYLSNNIRQALFLPGKESFKRGELANAEGMLRRALAIDPNNSSDRYFRGRTLIEAGREHEGRQMRGHRTFPGPAAPVEI
jgi:tetratricopeptide (TPR) repeat protein